MFEDLSGKFGKLKMPEGSLIKKLERIKKSSAASEAKVPVSPSGIDLLGEQFKKASEDMTKKIEEMVSSKTEQLKASAEAVKTLESQVSKMDQMITQEKKGKDEFKTRLDKIDETVLELLSLYEVVSSTVNPFVGDKPNPVTEKLADIEKKVEELSQKAPEVPPNLTQDFESKFKSLENNMEELKKLVESNVANQDALVEKVAGIVVERIKPMGQKTKTGASLTAQPHAPNPAPGQVASTNEAVPMYGDDGIGPRLAALDNRPETSIILLNWLEFLMEKVGRNNLMDVLEYYIDIGWISEEVSSKMMDYANGIDYYVERPTWKLLPEDHTKSLMFIEQLLGRKIDKNLFSKLERDVNKIVRSSEILIP